MSTYGEGMKKPGVWVSYHTFSDYPPDSFAVHADELDARRFAMDDCDPHTKVSFLPFGMELGDYLKNKVGGSA